MKKKTFSLIALTLCLALAAIPFVALPGADGARIENRYSYKGILTLYSLDTFEGGINSRADFLNRAAISFEKKNRGVFVQVVPVSEYELEDRLARGLVPDILLYSFGHYRTLADRFVPYTQGVTFADSLRQTEDAVPVWYGGYFGFSANPEYPYVCGKAENTNPVLACLLSDTGIVPEHEYTQKSAYEAFVFKKCNLIGTQRDIYRTRNSDRQIERRVFSNYTDLVQYGSVVGISEERAYFAQKFLEYLTSPEIQAKLTEIGMFSVSGERLYDGVMGEFEEMLPALVLPRLDRSREEIAEEYERSVLALTDENVRRELLAAYR